MSESKKIDNNENVIMIDQLWLLFTPACPLPKHIKMNRNKQNGEWLRLPTIAVEDTHVPFNYKYNYEKDITITTFFERRQLFFWSKTTMTSKSIVGNFWIK